MKAACLSVSKLKTLDSFYLIGRSSSNGQLWWEFTGFTMVDGCEGKGANQLGVCERSSYQLSLNPGGTHVMQVDVEAVSILRRKSVVIDDAVAASLSAGPRRMRQQVTQRQANPDRHPKKSWSGSFSRELSHYSGFAPVAASLPAPGARA